MKYIEYVSIQWGFQPQQQQAVNLGLEWELQFPLQVKRQVPTKYSHSQLHQNNLYLFKHHTNQHKVRLLTYNSFCVRKSLFNLLGPASDTSNIQ